MQGGVVALLPPLWLGVLGLYALYALPHAAQLRVVVGQPQLQLVHLLC